MGLVGSNPTLSAKYFFITYNMKKLVLIIIIILLLIVAGIAYLPTKQEEAIKLTQPIEKTVTWEEAVNILNTGQVAYVMQAHNLDVILYLKNNTTLKTKEPHIDDIIFAVEKCGEPCKDLPIATE